MTVPHVSPADILRGNILIVDDKPTNVLLLERMLAGASYSRVSSTTDPTKVCELYLEHRYDLILLDLQMPGMDGFQVLENLQDIEREGYLPVLVVTAQPDHKLRALRAGARDFISKPFEVAEVLIRVRNLLEVRLLHLQTKRLYERVMAEREVSERLVRNLLPATLLGPLTAAPQPEQQPQPGVVSGGFAEVTALFADVVGFTRFCEGASATMLIGVLEELSRRAAPDAQPTSALLDDALLAAVGLPDAVADQTIAAARGTVDLLRALDNFNAHSRVRIHLRLGLDIAHPAQKHKVAVDLG